ncbi:TetR/AcrR family transcriptional regulator [Vibrio sp. VB16]|uniref:TetR/AcrR family transcriptional regulator n=1 Tax=Vibrio sp. VB16 TaxID=2785746 RepID=UPI00189D5AFA|nr:TetR/AcrR family transcriptional regulator [Vibrio sp. VB16]UGA57267.1 TetR/AcrR family transcriptional regulator [Vibrio sp. VB16]
MKKTDKKAVGRPIDDEKTQKVFEAIDNILANEGISKLSIERIANTAKISKATLYRRFRNLKGILNAYVETFTSNALTPLLQDKKVNVKDPIDLEQLLIKLGTNLMKLITQPRVIAFDNAMLSAGVEYSELKQDLFKKGPQNAIRQIGNVLEQAGIVSDFFDSYRLGDILFHIWRSGVYDKARVSGQVVMNSKQLDQHITLGTQFFLTKLI